MDHASLLDRGAAHLRTADRRGGIAVRATAARTVTDTSRRPSCSGQTRGGASPHCCYQDRTRRAFGRLEGKRVLSRKHRVLGEDGAPAHHPRPRARPMMTLVRGASRRRAVNPSTSACGMIARISTISSCSRAMVLAATAMARACWLIRQVESGHAMKRGRRQPHPLLHRLQNGAGRSSRYLQDDRMVATNRVARSTASAGPHRPPHHRASRGTRLARGAAGEREQVPTGKDRIARRLISL